MRHVKEEPPWIIDKPINLHSAVDELHRLGSQDLNKLLCDPENFTIQSCTKGSNFQVDMERLARCLPVHLIAVLVSSDCDGMQMQYLLSGFQLLHSFCDLASRNTKLEQILLDDTRVTEQIIDLIFYTIVDLARFKQDIHATGLFPLLHSALVASCLYLLAGYVSSQWKDLAQVLVSHPEVDLFMDAAFNSLRIDILVLQVNLSTPRNDILCNKSNLTFAEREAHNICQQCEASLQFLQNLCQQKLFCERLLKNNELCKNGGILSLVQAILKLDTVHCNMVSKVVAAVSRMKSKVLSILLLLCETESISYLDEVASSPRSMQVAKFVALEVLQLLKTAFGRNQQLKGDYPSGLVLLNTMRLADIFSDDSNFRYFITINITHVLAGMLLLSHEEFLISWCCADHPVVEEDASLEYDPFVAAGVVLSTCLNTSKDADLECTFNLNSLPQASYTQHRTSLLVKIIANLHCFVPNICEEQERNLFFNKFLQCLRIELPKSPSVSTLTSNAHSGATICRNLGSLLNYATLLIPTFLNEDDVHLLSKFSEELQSFFTSKVEGSFAQEQDQDKNIQHSLGRDKFTNLDAGESRKEPQTQVHVSSLTSKVDPNVPRLSLDLGKVDYAKEGTSESLLYQENVTTEGNKVDSSASESLREIDRDPHNIETSGSEASSTRGKEAVIKQLDNGDLSKFPEHVNEHRFNEVEENDKSESTNGEEKQRRKRKRNIMNEKQITVIERALLDEPDMQRNASLLQAWADKLSVHGSELTSSQLKNWLNNRKAKLARVAREGRVPSEGENAFQDKSGGLVSGNFYDSPESPSEEFYIPSTTRRGNQGVPKSGIKLRKGSSETPEIFAPDFAAQQSMHMNSMSMRYIRFEPGQYVCLLDKEGKEVGKGKVFQVEGVWYGSCLEEVGTCVVDITELKVEKSTRLQHPSEATGTTLEEAEIKIGVMRVAWDANNIILLPK